MVEVTENRIVHKVIHDVSYFDERGHYYSTVIPLNSQVYAMYPSHGEKTGLWYVYGDGVHTYDEIRRGKGNREQSKEYPVFSTDFIDAINAKAEQTYVDAELLKKQIINNIVTEINSQNKTSLEKYTSVKSVADYVDEAYNQLTTLINTLNHDLSGLISNLNIIKADKDTVYTRTEIDNMMFSVYKPKGSVRNKEALPTTGNRVGDVYNVLEDSMNYVWTADLEWDALGPIIDLSPYCLKSELAVERTRATNAENVLQNNIDTNSSLITQVDVKFDNKTDSLANSILQLQNKDTQLETNKADKTQVASDIQTSAENTLLLASTDAGTQIDSALQDYSTTAEMNNSIGEVRDLIPTKVSQIENDVPYATQQSLSDYATIISLNEQITALQKQINDLKLTIPQETFTADEMRTFAKKSGKITLCEDINLGTISLVSGTFDNNITSINLNGHTLTASPTGGRALLQPRGTAQFTFNGDGTVEDFANDSSCIWTRTKDNIVTINGGTWIAHGHTETIYCQLGTIYINGGTFKTDAEDKRYVLNCLDANFKAGTAKIIVTGGEFYDFDPSNNPEGPDTTYVADGYTVTSRQEDEHTIYTVIKA